MLINNFPPVDTTPVLAYYNKKGLDISKLEKCNSQEFKYIDGFGEGFFLMTQNITSEFVTFVVDDRSISLKVLDRLSLEHPAKTGVILYIYHTAEPKCMLYRDKVQRNFNVTIRKSLALYDNPTILTLAPDYTPKSLEEILQEILSDTYTLSYDAEEIISYDIAIEGLSHGDALDHLCSIYGLVWTADANTVYVFNMEPGDTSSADITPGFNDPIKDINHTQLSRNLSTINVTFPVYDWVRTTPKEYITVEDTATSQGKIINVQDPYYFAVLDSLDSVRNQPVLDSRASLIVDNLEAIASSINFIEYNYYNLRQLGQQPLSLSEVVGDLGYGPLTIYRQIKYPYLPVHRPVCKDRLANNWIGFLTDGYYGTVSSFIVTPQIPIDGALPPGPQRVFNKYSWNYGEQGWLIRVEWSPFEGIWIGLQQEYDCPPEEEPILPPPTEPVDPWPEEQALE